jgi:DNA (cytosine-5)-methyltransferase 1
VPKIVLIGGILTDKAYTTAWKALEAELASLRMKADLVQLSGYYQYRPAIQAKLTVYGRSTSPTWTALSKVCAGIGVRETLPAGRIADLWGMTEAEVLETARHLRSIGYEVRNRHTNPEIPRNYFLIPYSFPTLSPLSVQLRKSLTKDSTWQKAAQTTTAFAAR